MIDDLAGKHIRYRVGLGRTERGRCVWDRGKSLDVDPDGNEGKTIPVKRSAVIQVLPDPRPYTGPGPVQPPNHDRPGSPIQQGVRDVAERKARAHPTYLDHIRAHPCAVAYLGDCAGPVIAHHMPPKGMGGTGSDFATVALCDKHHREWHARYRLGPMTRDETSAHLHLWQVRVLSKWMEERAA